MLLKGKGFTSTSARDSGNIQKSFWLLQVERGNMVTSGWGPGTLQNVPRCPGQLPLPTPHSPCSNMKPTAPDCLSTSPQSHSTIPGPALCFKAQAVVTDQDLLVELSPSLWFLALGANCLERMKSRCWELNAGQERARQRETKPAATAGRGDKQRQQGTPSGNTLPLGRTARTGRGPVEASSV